MIRPRKKPTAKKKRLGPDAIRIRRQTIQQRTRAISQLRANWKKMKDPVQKEILKSMIVEEVEALKQYTSETK